MSINVSKNSLSNRRLFLADKTVLIDFSDSAAFEKFTCGDGAEKLSIQTLPTDKVSEGTHALRIEAAGGDAKAHNVKFGCKFDSALNMNDTPMLYFTFSPYDGEHDSLYFQEMSENKYFVEKPDPELVSLSYIAVTLHTDDGEQTRTVQLTNYGFNRIYANFSDCDLSRVYGVDFEYIIDEDVPGWQGICKLDTVYRAMSVDFTLKGGGLDRLCEVKNGTVTHADGILAYTAQSDSYLTLPDLANAENTICDVFLPVKNTVLPILSSDTDISLALTLEFKTEDENFYSDDKSKTFTLKLDKTPRACYLNISDVPKATGRLSGLRLRPADACKINIHKIAFEQERVIRQNSGYFTECTSDGNTISLSFNADDKYIGCPVEIYRVYPQDIYDCVEDKPLLASTTVSVGVQTVTFPYMGEKISYLSSQFLGAVKSDDGYVYFTERGMITNWSDLCGGNPYAFDIADRTYSVSDFGAYGDGFHDDTDAIQAAIDKANAEGGGKVIIDGDGSEYGKRYLLTNITLKSNVELHIAENAVLWQSDDISMYKRLPRFGHNVSMTGVNWPANHTCGNFPLIYAFRQHNIKLTGPGMIRMCDTGSRSLDGLFKFIGDNVCIGCCDRMHVIPVGIVESENIEVSNLKIIRSSATHLCLNHNKNGFFANIFLDEAKCTGADGMWPLGSNGMKFTRIMLNSNDDGICMSSNYNDPRDVLWNFAYPGNDRGTHNIELSHSYFNCYTFTASAVSFCTWGTDAPELDRQEVSDIHIYDTSLEGRVAVGGWTDNPYYGKCPFDGSETDDFSPVKNVHLHNCDLRSPLGLGGLRITNFDSDITDYHSPSDFEYGSFTRREAERNPYWTSGLSNWSYTTKEAVRQINLYGVNCGMVLPVRDKVCDLYQGLYLTAGKHTLTFDYKGTGSFEAFVKDKNHNTLSATILHAEAASYTAGKDFVKAIFEFTVPCDDLYHIGVEGDYELTNVIYATNFKMD